MSISKENKYPEIRFKGFTEAWEQRELGDMGSVVMNKRIFKEQTSAVGDIPFYKIGTFGREPDAYISRELFEEYKENYPYPGVGDILLSASGSIGRTVVYDGQDEYFQDSNIVWLKHDGRLENKFLKQFYSIVKWQGLEGSTIKRLYNKNILHTNISVPSSSEQVKIGYFFEKLDDTIALHQQKVDKLEKLKKAYLQDIFPKKEEMPMISFSNNQGTWKIRKFKDFIKKTGKNNKEGKDYYAYSVSNKLGLVKQSEQFEGSRLDDLSKTDYKIVLPGEFVYNPARINVGSIAYNDSETIIIVSSLYVVLKMNELLNNGYILSIIATSDFINEVKRNTEGSVREYLFFNSFRNIKFPYLNSTSDQKKIGLFFQDLNKIITLTRKKVDKLKKIKKAYLQKMFV